MKKLSTPFPTVGYYGKEYFCNRDQETKKILSNIRGGQSTILTAPRRIGKTALIRHAIHKLPSDIKGVYLDILPTENLNELLNELATAVIRNINENRGFGKKLWDFIKSLRPVIKFDQFSGSPQVSFEAKESDVKNSIENILLFLENQQVKFAIAIDEFQQILKYPEKNTEAWLRTIIQRLKNVVFIFSGSQHHIMNEMFTLPTKPFFNSAGLLRIGKIEKDDYTAFISRHFKRNGRLITNEVITDILDWADGHTYYVQLICNRIFLSGNMEIDKTNWMAEAAGLIREQEPVFFNYRNMLTLPQWDLLKATAFEGELYEPTAMDFIKRHSLGNPSTVLRSLSALLRMELIYYDFNLKGRKYYILNDLLFRRWVGKL